VQMLGHVNNNSPDTAACIPALAAVRVSMFPLPIPAHSLFPSSDHPDCLASPHITMPRRTRPMLRRQEQHELWVAVSQHISGFGVLKALRFDGVGEPKLPSLLVWPLGWQSMSSYVCV